MGRKHFVLKQILIYSCLVLISGLYLFLRLNFKDTIEFGYDQPLLSSDVLNFISHPTYLELQNYVMSNPWGSPSWGPAQVLFWVPFILITHDPISISILAAVFNLIGLIAIFFIGNRFYNSKVGLIASLIFATHPWSVIFSRMIYEPSMIATLIAILMFLSLYILEKPRSWLVSVLIVGWGFITQIYMHTVSFVVPSVVALLLNINKVQKKYVFVGVVFSILFFLPTFIFFFKNPSEVLGFYRVSNKFTELRQESPYTIKDILYEFLGTLGGGRLKWQLGYGYDEFVRNVPFINTAELTGIVFVSLILIYHLLKIFTDKEKRTKRVLLLSWMCGPIFFLTLIKTPIALPRYFLLSLPALSLLFAIFIDEVSESFKSFGRILYLFPVLISGYWIFLMVNYYGFVTNFNYTNGFLSSYSDVPYSFLDKSFRWIKMDAANKSISNYTVSSDLSYPYETRLNTAQSYYWDNILDKNFRNGKVGYYIMRFTDLSHPAPSVSQQFGPYVVYEVNN